MNELNPVYCHRDHGLEDKRDFISNTDLFCRVIENADGVPFQIIFGPEIGEGLYFNIGAGVEQLLGVAPDLFTERLFSSMVEKVIPLTQDMPADPAGIRRLFLSGAIQNYRAELLVRTPSGATKWIQDASVPITDDETGKVIGAFGILHDITQKKKVFSESPYGNNGSISIESAFLRNISHEIRTPLNAIVGFSALLNEEGHDAGEEKYYRDIITSNSDMLVEIVTNIMELSKIEAGTLTLKKSDVDPAEALKKVHSGLSHDAANKGLHFSCSTPGDDSVTVIADEPRLEQALMHIAGNAIKFTAAGRVDMGYEVKQGSVEIYIADTGPGIAEEHETKIFDRFYQAESSPSRSFGGTGIGLTIAKAYIEQMGGKIWFTSEPGKGTEFRVSVPRSGR